MPPRTSVQNMSSSVQKHAKRKDRHRRRSFFFGLQVAEMFFTAWLWFWLASTAMQQKCALLHEQWGEAVEVQVTFENMSSIFPPELRYFTDNVAWQDRIKNKPDKQQAWLFQWQSSLHVSVVQVSPKQMGALAPCDHTSNSRGHNYQLTGAAVSIGPRSSSLKQKLVAPVSLHNSKLDRRIAYILH